MVAIFTVTQMKLLAKSQQLFVRLGRIQIGSCFGDERCKFACLRFPGEYLKMN